MSETFTFSPGAGLPGQIWVSRQPKWHQNIADLADKRHPAEETYRRVKYATDIGLKAMLGAPIIANGQVLAVLVFYMTESRPEDWRLVELVLAVATQVGTVLQQKRAGEQIRKLSRAVEQSANSVIITNIEGNIEYVNPKFTQITGYTAEEVIGQNPRLLQSGETPSEKYKRLWHTITSGGEWRGELHNKRKNGELYWVSSSISPVKTPAGVITHFLAIQEDITEQKLIEEERRISYQQQHI